MRRCVLRKVVVRGDLEDVERAYTTKCVVRCKNTAIMSKIDLQKNIKLLTGVMVERMSLT